MKQVAAAGKGAPSPAAIAAVLTIALRIVYSGIGALLAPGLELRPELRLNAFTENLIPASDRLRYTVLGVWERFDTLWYLHIATHGYDRPAAVVFYPLYPLLIRVLSVVLEPLVAALLLSTVSSFFLFWGFQKLLRFDFPAEAVTRGVLLYAVWPAAFIFLAGYPDSLVAALLVWSVCFARMGRWWAAGLLGCAAGLTKAVGLLAIVSLAVLAWRKRDRAALPAALCLAAPAGYALFLQLAGLPQPAAAYPAYWHTELALPFQTIAAIAGARLSGAHAIVLLNLLALAVVTSLVFAKKTPWEYRLLAIAAACLLLTKKTSPMLQSTMRYVLVVFPAQANLGRLLSGGFWFAVCALVLFLLNGLTLWAFFEWLLLV